MPEKPTVAVIGLGNMGFPMLSRLADAGFPVRGFDVAPGAVERVAAIGATGCATAAEAVTGSEVVLLMLPNSAIVTAVVDELLGAGVDSGSALAPGTLLLDMSSSEPLATQALAERLAGHGIPLVDAPVSGGVKGAERGTLAIMAGGEPAEVDRAEVVLSVLGKVTRTGAVGSGHALKALNNLLSATHLWATSEVMIAGQRFGLDPEIMLAVFNAASGRSGSTDNKWPNFILPGGYDSGFGLRLMLKDMRIAQGLTESTGAYHRLADEAVAHWAEAADALEPTADHTEVARWIADAAAAAQD
ncbi:hypothetical protein GCM10027515_33590 [Schumannella luteola]|uniref:3-hydroxyisobutyrate dehydrogenase n=1 Tax=Schumannella luteola TaxID=472059 RepID=A0A852YNI2_9MICO|nr:3-hydroxyisobutyrate dehydrogenase [Schumannella luteola]